jgi:hypothetical protein
LGVVELGVVELGVVELGVVAGVDEVFAGAELVEDPDIGAGAPLAGAVVDPAPLVLPGVVAGTVPEPG